MRIPGSVLWHSSTYSVLRTVRRVPERTLGVQSKLRSVLRRPATLSVSISVCIHSHSNDVHRRSYILAEHRVISPPRL